MNPCIVYLAQNSQKDTQYGRDSRSMLERSLDLFFENYNNQFRHPVLIFHEGDFKEKDQREIIKGRDEIKFCEIQFSLPDFLNPEEVPEKWDNIYGIGFRHMIRFYYLQVFDILEDMGYDWFFRMDDDSFFHSKIDYNLFEFMVSNGYDYGYRVDIKEPVKCSFGFSETVVAYLKAEGITPHSFYNNFENGHDTHQSILSTFGRSKRMLFMCMEKFSKVLGYDMFNAPNHAEWDRWGYYNNFFITNIAFWKQPKVQSFLHYLDRIGAGYKYRWSDLIIQTAAVQIFLPDSKIYKFTDWTYEHATIKNGKLDWGGIYEGTDDQGSDVVKFFEEKYGRSKIEASY